MDALINNGLLEEAEAASLRVAAVAPLAAPYLPWIRWRLGRRHEAVASAARLYSAAGFPEAARALERLGAKSPEAAWRWDAERWGRGEHVMYPNYNDFFSALIYAELGDWEAALGALERSVAEREAGMERQGLDPLFDPIRDTPRFRALIEEMGLAPYHAKYSKREGQLPSPAAP